MTPLMRAARSLCAVAMLAVAVLLPIGPAQGQPAASTRPVPEDVEDRASSLAWWGDLDALEQLYGEVNRPGLYAAQGNVLVNDFRLGTQRAFATPKDTGEAFAAEVDALTLAWTQQRPQVPMVHWLRAQALAKRAWEVRGDGFANTVAPQAWADFRRLLERAVEHLARTKDVSLQDSSAYREIMIAVRGLGWDVGQLEPLLLAGRQRNPEDLSLWHQMLTGSLPKWGGSPLLVDRLIRRAADQHGERGDEIYARLYLAAAAEEFSHNVFRDTAADWPRIRKGLRDSIARWQAKAIFWNRLAYFACLKEDRETLVEALGAIQDKPDLDQWGKNARSVFESCKRLARQG
jgi:Domain of unknown function (DUF4034)